MYTPFDTRLEWLGMELLFKFDSNTRWRAKMQPIIESGSLLSQAWGPLSALATTRKL